MRLQIEVRFDLRGVIQQDIIHGDIVGAQVFGTIEDADLWEIFPQAVHDGWGIRIHRDLFDQRNGNQCFEDVMEERLARQHTVIFSGHTLGMVAHGNEGDKFGHSGLIIPNPLTGKSRRSSGEKDSAGFRRDKSLPPFMEVG
jgi:hypothetical protein